MTQQTANGYQATIEDGTMTVHRVPIFVECSRGDTTFDRDWISAAVAKAAQSASEGYFPPLHIRHHEPSTESTNAVRAAGFFRIVGTELIRFKGSARTAILADLVITDPVVQQEILQRRLPYRSVEIFDVNCPSIDSLALLDHEAPFLELPMLMIGGISELATSGGQSRVAGATFTYSPADTVACSFRTANKAHLLFREDRMSETDTEKKGDKMEGETGSLDVGAVVKAIKSGAISVADMDSIMAAIQEAEGKKEAPVADGPAPASAPGGESMKAESKGIDAAQFAALKGELDGTKARLSEMQADLKRTAQIAKAMQRLDGRPLGADLESKLVAFHRAHGEAAFGSYVDAMVEAVGPVEKSTAAGAAFAGHGGKVPDVAMKYSQHGADNVAKAAQFAAEWTQLKAHGHMRQTLDRYVEIQMARHLTTN